MKFEVGDTVKIIENFVKEITIDETTPTTVNTCIEEIFNVLQKTKNIFEISLPAVI